MSSVNYDAAASKHSSTSTTLASKKQRRAFHRIRKVREEQGMSLRSVARHTGCDMRTLRFQEQETTDLRLSELQIWHEALEVPIADLLIESDAPLSRPVLERARLVRIMKSAAAIRDQAPTPGIQRMAETLIEQLLEVMPELVNISAWHTYGQRRSLDEYGRVAERRISDDLFSSWDND